MFIAVAISSSDGEGDCRKEDFECLVHGLRTGYTGSHTPFLMISLSVGEIKESIWKIKMARQRKEKVIYLGIDPFVEFVVKSVDQ